MDQIEQAVLCALSPNVDPALKLQASNPQHYVICNRISIIVGAAAFAIVSTERENDQFLLHVTMIAQLNAKVSAALVTHLRNASSKDEHHCIHP
jgi:hypothetical protein